MSYDTHARDEDGRLHQNGIDLEIGIIGRKIETSDSKFESTNLKCGITGPEVDSTKSEFEIVDPKLVFNDCKPERPVGN
jgi:hypothetical protein